jgi:hypothetical protein
MPRLFAQLELTHGDGSCARLFQMLTKVDPLMLDDLGPDRLTAGQRRDLMEIIEERHGRGSTLIASQLPVKALARSHRRSRLRRCHPRCLIHNAYRLELEGPLEARDRPRRRSARSEHSDAGGVEWQVSERNPEISALPCLPPAPLDQQGLPARHCIQLVAGTQRRARAPPVDYGLQWTRQRSI